MEVILTESMRTWAEVSLDALAQNISAIRAMTDKDICAVVKADAYGHGAIAAAKRCESLGLRYLAVATLDEALGLRRAGISMPVLILGYTPPERALELVSERLTQSIFDREQAEAFSARLNAENRLRAHIKIDTGMSRLGLQSAEDAAYVCRLPGLEPEGFFTHYATADVEGDAFVKEQAGRFADAAEELCRAGVHFDILHCANSGGMLYYKGGPGNMIRVGLTMYGWNPSGENDGRFSPVMRFCTTVAQVKRISPGDTVSYGRTFTAARPADIAVLCCGYADGYPRSLSDKGYVLIGGARAPVVGRVCMDMMMADVTGLSVRAGDRAVLFGLDGGELLPLGGLARLAGTIPYELLCAVSARVPRVYV